MKIPRKYLAILYQMAVNEQVYIDKVLELDSEGYDWPSDYDPNDYPLYGTIKKELNTAMEKYSEEVDLNGKRITLLRFLIYKYVRDNYEEIGKREYEEISKYYYKNQERDNWIRELPGIVDK